MYTFISRNIDNLIDKFIIGTCKLTDPQDRDRIVKDMYEHPHIKRILDDDMSYFSKFGRDPLWYWFINVDHIRDVYQRHSSLFNIKPWFYLKYGSYFSGFELFIKYGY
jgi:hypothetical protein